MFYVIYVGGFHHLFSTPLQLRLTTMHFACETLDGILKNTVSLGKVIADHLSLSRCQK